MIEFYYVGAFFTLGVVLAEDSFDELTGWQQVYVGVIAMVLWPLALGICVGKAGLSGNKKK